MNTAVPQRAMRSPRLLVFACYVVGGALIFLFGSNYSGQFPTSRNPAYEAGLTVFFLALVLFLHAAVPIRPYARVAFALFIASFANAALLAFGHVLDPLLPVGMTSAQAIAFDKLQQALPIVLSIVLLTTLTGADLGAIFLRKGDLRSGLTFGLASFSICIVIFAGIVLAQADAPVTTGLTATGLKVSTVLAAAPWILIFIFANSFMEELWFRGVSLPKLTPVLGPALTVLATALVFASVHFGATYVNPAERVLFAGITFVLGLVNGTVMLKTGSIWGAVFFHAGCDLFVILPVLASI